MPDQMPSQGRHGSDTGNLVFGLLHTILAKLRKPTGNSSIDVLRTKCLGHRDNGNGVGTPPQMRQLGV